MNAPPPLGMRFLAGRISRKGVGVRDPGAFFLFGKTRRDRSKGVRGWLGERKPD